MGSSRWEADATFKPLDPSDLIIDRAGSVSPSRISIFIVSSIQVLLMLHQGLIFQVSPAYDRYVKKEYAGHY